MRVLLDQTEQNVTASTVAEALAAGASVAERQGRMIVEVMVDGRSWSSEDLEADRTHSRIAQVVSLTTADPVNMICEVFQDASNALGEADAMQQAAAQLFQTGHLIPGMQKLNEAFGIWLSVQQAVVMGTQLAGLELDSVVSPSNPTPDATADQPISEVIEQLNIQLRGVRTSLESRDLVALADTLLYDLPQVVLQWRGLLDDLQSTVRARPATAGATSAVPNGATQALSAGAASSVASTAPRSGATKVS